MKKVFANISIPHVFIFLSIIILFCSILTYIVPSGTFERKTETINNVQRTVVIPGTYKEIPKHFSVKGLILGEEVGRSGEPHQPAWSFFFHTKRDEPGRIADIFCFHHRRRI